MLFRRKRPSPLQPQQSLVAELTAILVGMDSLAAQIQAGKLTDYPDSLIDAQKRAEPLFLQANADGKIEGHLYHYTDDFKNMNANAQIDLVSIFGDPLILQTLLRNHAQSKLESDLLMVVGKIDTSRAKLVKFLRYLARYDIAAKILSNEMSDAAFKEEMALVAAEDTKAFEALLARALDRTEVLSFIKGTRIEFPILLSQRVDEMSAQRFNGVWLPKENAKAYSSWMAQQQAASMPHSAR
tara:strand:- start:6107 stop:6829 length:723 start_codon:yes stop_codon:yes gene_type:complete